MKTMVAVFAGVGLLSTFAACGMGGGGDSASKDAKSSETSTTKAAGPTGDSVGAPECDAILKKASSPECKDKPGMSTIIANRENWKNGLANASSKDATIQACKAAQQAVDAACNATMPGGTPGGAGSASAGSGAGSGSADSVGAPECDDILKKASDCKDKPGMSAILANRDNWKNGLANAATKDATLQACKAAEEAIKAVGCSAGGGAAGGGWDGKSPYTCTGNDNATITGVTANIASGPAITASGNCNVTFKGCTITTDKAIVASGAAQVTIDGGEIKASDTAIDASGAAQVKVTGAKVSGKITKTGDAKITGVPTK